MCHIMLRYVEFLHTYLLLCSPFSQKTLFCSNTCWQVNAFHQCKPYLISESIILQSSIYELTRIRLDSFTCYALLWVSQADNLLSSFGRLAGSSSIHQTTDRQVFKLVQRNAKEELRERMEDRENIRGQQIIFMSRRYWVSSP